MPGINHITIIGAGTMGYSLAVSFAAGGCTTSLVDNKEVSLQRGMEQVKNAFSVLVEAGKMTTGESQGALERITPTTQLREGVRSADLVVESVYENPENKREVLNELDRLCQPHTILASNTSWLDIFEIAKEVGRQDKLIITHWFSPPHIMPLVEVAVSDKTSSETIKTVVEVHKRLGKKVLVLQKFIPGCFINRLQYLISKEIFSMLDKGHFNIEDVDLALKASLAVRWPVTGFIQGLDFAGLDTINRTRTQGGLTPDWSKGPIKVVADKVAQGKTGVKVGEGFYSYTDNSVDEWFRKRDFNSLKVVDMIEELNL